MSTVHEHPPHLAHHFATPAQQFQSGKLGMWVFLATEILMFGGLFCAYAVYRANHPEIFLYAHQYLDKIMGGINTVVLICSSFTMAWAVRASQLNQRKLCVALLGLTFAGGCGFMGIKYVEYKAKWEHGLLPGKYYHPHEQGHAEADASHDASLSAAPGAHAEPAAAVADEAVHAAADPLVNPADAPKIAPAPAGPAGLAYPASIVAPHHVAEPRNVKLFFSVYFLMTGLHGVHVLVGMGLILWIMRRAARGEFSAAYFLPVDLVGLYWHLVDLIWIFLFPLLYLIH